MLVSVLTLGCKVNEVESRSIISELKKAGISVTEELVPADCYVLNTCAVTTEAERKCRQYLGKIAKQNAGAPVYVCGCSSQNNPDYYLSKKNVIYVCGSGNKNSIVGAVINDVAKRCGVEKNVSCEYENMEIPEHSSTRDFIKIQDGCNNFCSYCLIPFVRGRERSRSLDSILREADVSKDRTKEIVLTGINISSYGEDTGGSLIELCKALSSVPVRKRLGSLECGVITPELLEAMREGGFCDHFHLSLQSGCDRILKAMNRHYTTSRFLEKVKLIREYYPNAGITTDLIVGFPTETNDNFNETCGYLKTVGFSDVHVFAYSARPGTRAASMPQVDAATRKKRAEEAAIIKNELRKSFLKQQLGKELEVYFEETICGYSVGYSSNYVRVYSKEAAPGELQRVVPNRLFEEGVL